jgi:hypothetical protein
VWLVIANTSQGREFRGAALPLTGGSKSSSDRLGHFSAADYMASLPRLPRCTNRDHHLRSLLSTHLDHYAHPGQEKRNLRLSAEALSRSSEQIGRMVELQIITELDYESGGGRSNRSGRAI